MQEQISLESLDLVHGTPYRGSHNSRQRPDDEASFNPTPPLSTRESYENSTQQPYPQYTGSRSHDEFPGLISSKPKKPRRQWLTGWKQGTAWSALLVAVILLVNVIITALCQTNLRNRGYNTPIAPLTSGDCKSMKQAGIAIHLVINVISTLLLGASNYCMQTISAPTREDVDQAHAKYSWVDIGIPSLRNLYWIRKRRVLVWLLLGISSVPLHLVYNSTFFVSTISNLYPIWFADESFAQGAAFNETFFPKGNDTFDPWSVQEKLVAGGYQNLTNDECIKSYANTVLGDRGGLVLVVERPENCTSFKYGEKLSEGGCGDTSKTSLYNVMHYEHNFRSQTSPNVKNWYYWICNQKEYSNEEAASISLCSDGEWKNQLGANPWTPGNVAVKYCLSEKVESQCQLNVALSLLYVVIAFNAIKLVLIATMAATSLINLDPLVTIGDAIDSFIKCPDPKTAGLCLTPIHMIKRLRQYSNIRTRPSRIQYPNPIVGARPFKSQRRRLWAAVGLSRWLLLSIMSVVALIAVVFLLVWAAYNMGHKFNRGSLPDLWNMGFGAITPYNIIQGYGVPTEGVAAVIQTVLIVNLPQLILSLIYLMFNAVTTSMTAAIEWANYAHQSPKPLRVSFPEDGQRSTFFLQMPYRYSVPMMVLSVLIHWLISQSLFMIKLNERLLWTYKDADDRLEDGEYETFISASFSPMAMILTCIVFTMVCVATVLLGTRRLKGEIPLVGSCSLGIAAACHVSQETITTAGVKWGALDHGNPEIDGHFGHCAFSNEDVDLPIEGVLYF